MSLIKRVGMGAALGVTTSTTSTSYTTIAGLMSLNGPEASAEDIDTTTIDNATKYKTFVRGAVDAGEVSGTLAYGSTDAGQKKLGSLLGSGTIVNWKITVGSTAATETFTGYLKGLGRAIERASMITRSFAIKVSGGPGFPTT